MKINQLIEIIKKKIRKSVSVEELVIEDKTFLHKNHTTNQIGKFHIKLKIKSIKLSKMNKIQSTKVIYGVLAEELKENIHSIQILID
jgi:BolA protein|tara:strand:- start:294 stop:554 length:261 start_codon:yes stop_codon:yes gene_type:complete